MAWGKQVAMMRAEMRGFLEYGLFEDHVALARQLRGLRTAITRAIAELEAGPSHEVRAEPEAGGVTLGRQEAMEETGSVPAGPGEVGP